jgi:hypothetical protein
MCPKVPAEPDVGVFSRCLNCDLFDLNDYFDLKKMLAIACT